MTIREYLINKDLISRSTILLELYENIKDEKSVPDLDILKSVDKELDKLFFEVVDKICVLNELINKSKEIILEEIDEIDVGFLNKKLPPHIKL
jgi:hypothetical protein